MFTLGLDYMHRRGIRPKPYSSSAFYHFFAIAIYIILGWYWYAIETRQQQYHSVQQIHGGVLFLAPSLTIRLSIPVLREFLPGVRSGRGFDWGRSGHDLISLDLIHMLEIRHSLLTGTGHHAHLTQSIMTSSNGTIPRATGHLCGQFTGNRWIHRTKASDAELWCFRWSTPE